MPKVVKRNGDVEYRNKKGQLHRVNGPAVIKADDSQKWYKNGKLHRTDGPAYVWEDGISREWFVNGLRHREDGPAFIRRDGYKEWCQNGLRHRENGPAVIFADGSQFWLQNGQTHRLYGPAVILADGEQQWWLNGRRHLEYGPAVIKSDGSQEWYLDGRLHRENGPAIIDVDGRQEWYLVGVKVDEELVKNLNSLTANMIHEHKNVELRSWLLQKMGWPKYLREINAKPIDTRDNSVDGTKEALYKVKGIKGKQLVVTCPTVRVFNLHVPEEIKTCEQAQNWLGNDVKNEFNVIGRT